MQRLSTYQDAEKFLQGGRSKEKRTFCNNTYVERRDKETIALRLHATDVVTFKPDRIILNSGHWRTLTTKERMNRIGGISVFSYGGVWYVKTPATIINPDLDLRVNAVLYFDGIEIDNDGVILNQRVGD